jgi:hypothetical protein
MDFLDEKKEGSYYIISCLTCPVKKNIKSNAYVQACLIKHFLLPSGLSQSGFKKMISKAYLWLSRNHQLNQSA